MVDKEGKRRVDRPGLDGVVVVYDEHGVGGQDGKLVD